jgi:glycosyltransferase involved in cell wall biosynthesis
LKSRILVLADTPGWAWHRKALAYQRHLSDSFDITVAYHASVPSFVSFDLIHLFEVSQVGVLTGYGPKAQRPFKAIAGLTAHVWRTWGEQRMHAWAAQVDALHGNSLLLVKDLQPFHSRVYYTPNGVDPEIYQRRGTSHDPACLGDPTCGEYCRCLCHTVARGPKIIFGHVGKPNPRKGGDLIVNAAREAGVELRLIQRTSKLALSETEMVDWYQGIDVMVFASNMDGTPNPALEGAACGCTLISTKIGNMPEFIDSANGCLLNCHLPYLYPGAVLTPQGAHEHEVMRRDLQEELRAYMVYLAAHPEEARLRGERARQTILDGWTWAHQVGHVKTMWTEVLG